MKRKLDFSVQGVELEFNYNHMKLGPKVHQVRLRYLFYGKAGLALSAVDNAEKRIREFALEHMTSIVVQGTGEIYSSGYLWAVSRDYDEAVAFYLSPRRWYRVELVATTIRHLLQLSDLTPAEINSYVEGRINEILSSKNYEPNEIEKCCAFSRYIRPNREMVFEGIEHWRNGLWKKAWKVLIEEVEGASSLAKQDIVSNEAQIVIAEIKRVSGL